MTNKKTVCDTCKRRKNCNTFDKTRGMACKDYKKQKENAQCVN
jgi:hypothetical protein